MLASPIRGSIFLRSFKDERRRPHAVFDVCVPIAKGAKKNRIMALLLTSSPGGVRGPPSILVTTPERSNEASIKYDAECDTALFSIKDVWGVFTNGEPMSPRPILREKSAKRLKRTQIEPGPAMFQLEIVLRPQKGVAILVTDASSRNIREFASALEYYRKKFNIVDEGDEGDYTLTPKLHRLLAASLDGNSDCDSDSGDSERPPHHTFAIPYVVLKRQRDAFELVDRYGEKHRGRAPLRVFSLEVGNDSSRKFIATSEEAMFQRILALAPSQRHYYEIIRESYPCRLFFDLEFNTASNPDADGPRMVECLIVKVRERLKLKYDLDVEARDFIELESSSVDVALNKKFSRHVVVHIRVKSVEKLFKDTTEMGRFVSEIVREDAGGKRELVLQDGTCFVDMSVYSRNRAFRMYLCSKRGKKGALLLAAESNPFQPVDCSTWHGERQFFSDTLVCPSRVWSSSFSSSNDGDHKDSSKSRHLLECAETSDAHSSSAPSSSRSISRAVSRRSSSGADVPREIVSVAIKFFESQVLTHWGPRKSGYVRSVTSYQQNDPLYPLTCRMPTFLVFDILGNRYCENIKREHKSNHISITFIVHRGVWFQRCHDYDCRHFRSRERSVPFEVVEATIESLLGLYCGC